MAEPALKRMTLDEFLVWDDGSSRRFQLVDGVPRAMAPAREGHAGLVIRLGILLSAGLVPPCRALAGAGIRLPHRKDAYYVADLAVTCRPPQPDLVWTRDPILIIEILSRATEDEDRTVKLIDYQRIPSLREIVLVSTEARQVEVWRRQEARWTETPDMSREALRLDSLGMMLPLAELYANTGIA